MQDKIDFYSPFRFAPTLRSIGDENSTVRTAKLGKGAGSKRTKDGGEGGGKGRSLRFRRGRARSSSRGRSSRRGAAMTRDRMMGDAEVVELCIRRPEI